jgi:hypothetical protein
MNRKGARDMEKQGELLFNGQSIEKALNDLLFSKSVALEYEPISSKKEPVSPIEKKISRLRYLMYRTKKRRKQVKLAWRILRLYELLDIEDEVA